MKQIYNEGRVVGLSQYEIYVRQALTSDPSVTPMSEKEWLTYTLANNSSLILRLQTGLYPGPHDFYLPEHSKLIGCTIIYGSLFQGEVSFEPGEYWGTSVTDYGELISNTNESHPVSPGFPENVPTKDPPKHMPTSLREKTREYIKITSALLIQPGLWSPGSGNEQWTLTPDLNDRPFVRIMLSEILKHDICILLHGFVNSAFYQSELSPVEHATTSQPENGDFLGPEKFPWCTPIVLTSTTDVQKAMYDDVTRLNDHVNFLASLQKVIYTIPLLAQNGQQLLTQSGQILGANKEDTVEHMWEEIEPDFPDE